ncbi:MAG: hypothetical protein WCD31_10320 [Gillisia sp.]
MNVKKIAMLGLFFLVSLGYSQQIALKKGELEDGVQVRDSLSETFAIYLPTAFTEEKAWPVIFVFDPEGRGRSAALLFQEAAEQQGYIVASSNNISKKDSLVTNLQVASRLLKTVFNFFPIDANRIYLAGFGEGGKVASAMPLVFNKVRGVITVGDVWINTDYIKDGAGFSFIGVAGEKDFHLYQMQEVLSLLKKTQQFARLYTFGGGYEWPGPQVLEKAVSAFTLRAMTQNIIPRDTLLVNSLYQRQVNEEEKLRRKMQPYKAYEALENMKSDFAVFNKEDALNDLQKEIKKNTDYRKVRNRYREAAIKESELKEEYEYFFNNDVVSAEFDNLGYWEEQMQELKKMQEGDNSANSEMAYRLQGLLTSWARKTYQNLKKSHASIDPLIFTSILSTIFDKQDPAGYMQVISLSSLDGDIKTALLYLEDLLKTGYKDEEALYSIPGTLELKMSPEFNALIKKYLGNSRYYDIGE